MVTSLEKLNLFLKQQPPRSGLVPKKVEVHTERGVFPAIRWVRPYHPEMPKDIQEHFAGLDEEQQDNLDDIMNEIDEWSDSDIARELRNVQDEIIATQSNIGFFKRQIVNVQGQMKDPEKYAPIPSEEERQRFLDNRRSKIKDYEKRIAKEMQDSKFLYAEKFLFEGELKNPEIKARLEREKERYISSPDERKESETPVKGKSKLGGGINVTEIIVNEDGKKFVFKPKSGEARRETGFGKTFMYTREIAAYQLAKELGIADKKGRVLVPKTIIKIVDGEIGSAQEYIEHGVLYKKRGDVQPKREQVLDAAILDLIIGSTDRHSGNSLIDYFGNIYLIDNGFSLFVDDDWYDEWGTYLSLAKDKKLEQRHVVMLDRVVKDPKIKDLIMRLFGEEDVYNNMVSRAKKALKEGIYTPDR